MARSGIPRSRVVRIELLHNCRRKNSTGFLLSPRTVLMSAHGLLIGGGPVPEACVRVYAPSRSSGIAKIHREDGVDLAVLDLVEDLATIEETPAVRWGKIDRTTSRSLVTAEAAGFPLWQGDVTERSVVPQGMAHLIGVIRPMEGTDSSFLTIRDRDLETVNIPLVQGESPDQRSPWSGLSGSAVIAESGHLLGIIIEDRPNDGKSALRILSVDQMLDGSLEAREMLGLTDPRSVSWAYPDPGGYLVRAYNQVVQLTPDSGLLERDAELSTLADRATSETWTWIVGEAFTGKTALLATFVSDAPAGMAVASCFLRRREGRASSEYALDTLTSQLAAISWSEVFTHQSTGKAEYFGEMLRGAGKACARRGDRLVLVIDGLDEYDLQSSVRLKDWLPTELPTGTSMIVASRPGCIPQGHPLHEEQVALAAFADAGELWTMALSELERAIGSSDLVAGQVGSLVAATGGGLRDSELAELCSTRGVTVDVGSVEASINRVFDRTLRRELSGGPVVFTHAAYRIALAKIIGPPRLTAARKRVDDWVDDMRRVGWRDASPYALRPYGRFLRARLDASVQEQDISAVQFLATLLSTTVSSSHRWAAILRAEGTPVEGNTEVVESVKALLDATALGCLDPEVAHFEVAVMGLRKGLVREQLSRSVESAVTMWAYEGKIDRAVELANAVVEPDARAYSLTGVAHGAARAGLKAATLEATVIAALESTKQAGPYRERATLLLAKVLADAQRFAAAGDVAAAVSSPPMRALTLAKVARAAASGGQHIMASALIEEASAIPIVNDNQHIFWAAVEIAEAWTLSGESDSATASLHRASDRATTGYGHSEEKYAHMALQVLEVGHLRCRVLAVDDDISLHELLDADAELRRLCGWMNWDYSWEAPWKASHAAAALARPWPTVR